MFSMSSLTGEDTEVQRIERIRLCAQPEKGEAGSCLASGHLPFPPVFFCLFLFWLCQAFTAVQRWRMGCCSVARGVQVPLLLLPLHVVVQSLSCV